MTDMSFTLHGFGVSRGIAIGRAMLMSHATLEVSHLTIAPRMVDKEVARFAAAIHAVKGELMLMKENTEHAPAELSAFIDIHTMFLEDPELVVKPRDIILAVQKERFFKPNLCLGSQVIVHACQHNNDLVSSIGSLAYQS